MAKDRKTRKNGTILPRERANKKGLENCSNTSKSKPFEWLRGQDCLACGYVLRPHSLKLTGVLPPAFRPCEPTLS